MSRQRDLFVNFDRVRREMDELFGDVWERTGLAPRRASGFSPRVDVYYCNVAAASEGEPKAVIKVDVAGVELGEISLEVSGRRLVISGERPVQETEGRVYEQLEIATGPVPAGRRARAPTSTPSARRPPTRTASCGSSCRSWSRARARDRVPIERGE